MRRVMQTRSNPNVSPDVSPNVSLFSAPTAIPLLRVVLARDGGAATIREFFHPVVTLGRGPAADLRLESDDISRLHCTIELRADGVWVRDLGSTNGVYMDGERIREAIVTPKSLVRVGSFRFKARQEAELHAEHTHPSTPMSRFEEAPVVRGTLETRVAPVPQMPSTPAPTFSRPAPVAVPAAPWAPSAPAGPAGPAVARVAKFRAPLPPKHPHRSVRAGDDCAACHEGAVLTWGGELRCRTCWTDGNVKPAVHARLGERCPCCHRGTMLTWEGGLRCRSCGNRGTSSRQPQPQHGKVRAGSRCPSCSTRSMLTWRGSVRCHGCGQSYR